MMVGADVMEAQESVMFHVPTISPPQAATLPHEPPEPLPLLLLPHPRIVTPIAMHALKAFMEVLRCRASSPTLLRTTRPLPRTVISWPERPLSRAWRRGPRA